MTVAAADMGLSDGALGLGAMCRNLHPPLKGCPERAANGCTQLEVLASVGPHNARDSAGPAKIGSPALAACFQQAALFEAAATVVITIEIRAFSSGGGSHGRANSNTKEQGAGLAGAGAGSESGSGHLCRVPNEVKRVSDILPCACPHG